MSRHEIEIEGLGPVWEPIAVAVPGEGEKIWTSKGIVSAVSAIHCEPALIVRRRVRNYDLKKPPHDWPQKIENENGATFILKCVNDDGSASYLCAPKVRKYDWSKTLPDVLIGFTEGSQIYQFIQIDAPYPLRMRIAPVWQPNIHGKCPVDEEACWVLVRLADGREREWEADVVDWSLDQKNPGDLVVAWQFIRLVDGYEW